jgi:hypothetical protein
MRDLPFFRQLLEMSNGISISADETGDDDEETLVPMMMDDPNRPSACRRIIASSMVVVGHTRPLSCTLVLTHF